MIVVSDASCLSSLHIIGKLHLLASIYCNVIIPEAVSVELHALAKIYPALDDFDSFDWIQTQSVKDQSLLNDLRKELDEGESEAILLAKELSADILVIDEIAGREIASRMGIKIIGLLGILIVAKQMGLIEKIQPLITELKTKAGFWISEGLSNSVLKSVGEL